MPPNTRSTTTTTTTTTTNHDEEEASPSKTCHQHHPQQSHPALRGSLTPPDTYHGPIRNFGPGPTSLPREVETAIQTKCFAPLFTESDLNDKRPRLSTMFLSHRSPEFAAILEETVKSTRRVLEIPTNYEILFLQGGGHGQFAAVPLNLCCSQEDTATYLVTGSWSARALEEAHKHCSPQHIDWRSQSSTKDDDTNNNTKQFDIDPNSKYIYVCSNETVDGIEIHKLTELRKQLQSSTSSATSHIPLVVDASSDVASKPIEWNDANVGIFFAGASKNIGIPGVTLVVIRQDLLEGKRHNCPGILDYRLQLESNNMYNTVPTFTVHVVGLMMEWILSMGGIHAMEERSRTKSRMVNNVIDQSNGFYATTNNRNEDNGQNVTVLQPSRMNIPFSLMRRDLTEDFLIEAWEIGIVGLRTLTPFSSKDKHQLRASLYHGVSLEDVKVLVDFMVAFAEKHKKSPCVDEKKEEEERVVHKGRQNMVLTTGIG